MVFLSRQGVGAVRATLLATSGLVLLFPTLAAAQSANQQAERVLIEGDRPADYKVDAPSLAKLTEPLIDTPISIDTVSEQVLKDRAATSLNDALRTIPTITIGAGEFKS